MNKKMLSSLTPSLIIGLGIILSSYVAVRAEDYGYLLPLAPLVICLAIALADLARSLIATATWRLSPAAAILATAALISGLSIAFWNVHELRSFLTLAGMAAWMVLLPLVNRERTVCNPSNSNNGKR